MPGKMNLPDDNEKGITPQMRAAVVMTACVTLLIIVIVLISNRKPTHHPQVTTPDPEPQTSPVIAEEVPPANTTTPSDLDFWDMYPEEKEGDEGVETSGSGDKESNDTETPEEEDDGLPPEAKDGRHTLVVNRDGKEEWLLISPYLPKNDYDYTNLVSQSGRMAYYLDGKEVSYLGLCVDKYDDYIDFNKIKNDGIDFVMLRVGVRGYGTGTLSLDEYYADNLSRATQAGLDIGLYFSSQAITVEEATEEALTLVNAIGDAKVSYPLAIDIGFIANDTSRIEDLTKAQKTEIIRAFADVINNAGYTCAIHADKEFLLKEIDLSKFTDVDIWIENRADLPDYPYAFTMWDYSANATVDGVSGYTDLTISFIDYTQK